MKRTFFPSYYQNFQCTADACPITCCQEWKIHVDSKTQNLWTSLSVPSDLSIQKPSLTDYLTQKDGQTVIQLTSKHRCPFLSDNKLCHLVLSHGDSALSETCTIFPRESHEFSDHTEKSLMPCCPAVIDLWYQGKMILFPDSDSFLSISQFQDSPEYTEKLLLQIRQNMIRIILENSCHTPGNSSNQTPEEILLEFFYILLELNRQSTLSFELIEEYFSDESLQALSNAIADIDLPLTETLAECNELFQDLSVNYEKEGLYQEFLGPLLSCARNDFSELPGKETFPELWESFQKGLAPFQNLLHSFLANEFYTDLVLPGYSLEEIFLKLQWIAMEYTAIRHSLFLSWINLGSLSYDLVRQSLVIISRMTGYEDEDIFSYLENSFESPFWDWGYFALITGRP